MSLKILTYICDIFVKLWQNCQSCQNWRLKISLFPNSDLGTQLDKKFHFDKYKIQFFHYCIPKCNLGMSRKPHLIFANRKSMFLVRYSRTSECSACWSSDCTGKISTTFRRFDKSKHSEVVCVIASQVLLRFMMVS